MRAVLVIARYMEDLNWVADVPSDIDICILNKGTPIECDFNRKVEVNVLDNIGREADSYLQFIIRKYHDLPDRVIFCQGDPFEHSPYFLELLNTWKDWKGFQPLTMQFKDYLPPGNIRLDYAKHAHDTRVWVDRTDCTSLDTVFYPDPDFAFFRNRYAHRWNLTESSNIVLHLLHWTGFHPHLAELDEVNFCFGAIFSVDRDMILRHQTDSYRRMVQEFAGDHSLPYIAERSWMAIFDIESAKGESTWSLPLSARKRTTPIEAKPTRHAKDFKLVNRNNRFFTL